MKMARLKLVEDKSPQQTQQHSIVQGQRRRIASLLHILAAEVECCAESLAQYIDMETSPEESVELLDKVKAIQSISHLMKLAEPEFEDPEYSLRPKPVSASTVEWLNILHKKKIL